METSTPAIIVKPTAGISQEEARNARARALRYAIDRFFERQRPAEINGDDNMEGRSSYGQKSQP